MSDNGYSPNQKRGKLPLPRSYVAEPVDPKAQEAMRRAAEGVMTVEDVTLGEHHDPIRLRGRLLMPADKAFAHLRPQFEAVGHTPLLRREEGLDVIRALPIVFGREKQGIPWMAITLLATTLLSVFFVGLGQGDGIYEAPVTIILSRLTGNTDLLQYPRLMPTPEVWRQALLTGLLYMLSLIGILGAHEMGHYLMARHHKVHTTLPFFIPMPIGFLGTLGAVIAMRELPPNRRVQFDIGVAGPIAGLIITVPVLLLGLSLSEVATVAEFLARLPEEVPTAILHEGQSLAYLAAKYLIFGQILPQGDLDVWIHPVALAGWAGLLVTALNLLPIGQLDGGHVIYGLFGKDARKVRGPVIVALLVMAIFGSIQEMAAQLPPGGVPGDGLIRALAGLPIPGWSGWWVWLLMAFFLLRRHAPVLDEITELDGRRRALGVVMLIVFILIFTPVPTALEAEPLAAVLCWFV
jgi:membrane-associated protease RseP (regulator of RpoE activity)